MIQLPAYYIMVGKLIGSFWKINHNNFVSFYKQKDGGTKKRVTGAQEVVVGINFNRIG